MGRMICALGISIACWGFDLTFGARPAAAQPALLDPSAITGIEDGRAVNLQRYFSYLVAGRPAAAWPSVLNDIEPALFKYGFGQQRSSAGAPRGRLFLPTADCPNAAPDPTDAFGIMLGVRQDPRCWTHAVDVVDGGPAWTWVDRGGPAYVPYGGARTPADFDGNGLPDLAVYRPATGTWFAQNVPPMQWGTGADVPVPGDYRGSGRTQAAVFRRRTGQWFIAGQGAVGWGVPGDVPVNADYNGDGITDVAVFRPSTGTWFVRGHTTASFGAAGDIPVPGDYLGTGRAQFAVFRRGAWFINGRSSATWGAPGDIPVPADYDGDRQTDVAVYRPSTGAWYVLGKFAIAWGALGDIPVPMDANGDGRVDLVVYRPSTGTWFAYDPRTGAAASASFGAAGDLPVVNWSMRTWTLGDLDGDRRADLSVFRDGAWFTAVSSSGFSSALGQFWGSAGDIPVPGDFLGVGWLQRAVFRAGTWYIEGGPTVQLGAAGDLPVVADFDGDRRADLAVFRSGLWFIAFSSTNYRTSTTLGAGAAGDVPVVGDYDGDGRADIGIFRSGYWFGLFSSSNYTISASGFFGNPGDVPVEGDYDGDGRFDIAVYRPSTGEWFTQLSSNGSVVARQWGGVAGDLPVPGDFDGDGRVDPAIFRNGTWFVAEQYSISFGLGTDLPILKRP